MMDNSSFRYVDMDRSNYHTVRCRCYSSNSLYVRHYRLNMYLLERMDNLADCNSDNIQFQLMMQTGCNNFVNIADNIVVRNLIDIVVDEVPVEFPIFVSFFVFPFAAVYIRKGVERQGHVSVFLINGCLLTHRLKLMAVMMVHYEHLSGGYYLLLHYEQLIMKIGPTY